MNRTDRLYAIVEELRAVAPRLRTARELAQHYEVSVRTIERDIGALQQAGVPIYADVGRRGGYALEKSMSLPPLNFTAAETVALAVALERSKNTPFAVAGRSAMRKILAAMPERNATAAHELAARVRLLDSPNSPPLHQIPPIIEQAIQARRVLDISYLDRLGVSTQRHVEPVALLDGAHGWYLVAWCRLRDQARCFRLDRIVAATLTDEPMAERAIEGCDLDLPDCTMRIVALG